MPERKVELAGRRSGRHILRLRHSLAQQVADIVLVDSRLEAQLAGLVEEHIRSLQLDGVALLACEVENGQ